jgi:nitrogen regulatory protein PII-like uncharacterized protein
MNFKEILKEQFKDLVTEETLTAVYEAFEQAVSEKATTKAEQLTEEKLNEQAEKLQEKINFCLHKNRIIFQIYQILAR